MDFCEINTSSSLRSDHILSWFETSWRPEHPETVWLSVWSRLECFKRQSVLGKLPSDHDFHGYTFLGVQPLDCGVVSDSVQLNAADGNVESALGAYIYQFASRAEPSQIVEVAAICTQYSDSGCHFVAFACVPETFTASWTAFENECTRLAYSYDDQDRVIIVGSYRTSFVPTAIWDDIVLPPALKADIMEDVQSFFETGVHIYTDLNLKPFRKLLLAGVPGTGKTLLCNALAKWALQNKYLVIYVSSAQKQPSEESGATFSKIQYALDIAQNSQRPTLIIVEELDAYLKEHEKAVILNVLDGSESAFNPYGTLLIATTNYPEAIDPRVLKRPGRLDRIFIIPEVKSRTESEKMLRYYLGKMWQDSHAQLIDRLVGYPGAFIREVAIYALTQVAYTRASALSYGMLEDSFENLKAQIAMRDSFLKNGSSESEESTEAVPEASGK